jgi:hypothetical protein
MGDPDDECDCRACYRRRLREAMREDEAMMHRIVRNGGAEPHSDLARRGLSLSLLAGVFLAGFSTGVLVEFWVIAFTRVTP